MIFIKLAWQSIWNRRVTVLLSVLTIALAVALLLGIEKVRHNAKQGFLNTISGTDLIVGARAGNVQLLLYSVFHLGNATNNISVKTLDKINSRKAVGWIVPISLGDSYRGHRVVGTTKGYFEHFRYRGKTRLQLQQGLWFDQLFDVVLGSEVAAKFQHETGDKVVLSHGTGRVSFTDHTEKPFRVSGVLEQTGTPVDRSVFVSLEAIEAIHFNWQAGQGHSGPEPTMEELQPKYVTAAFVGLKSKLATFGLQRYINELPDEPVTAVLPGVAFAELWAIIANVETALLVISAMVVATALIGMIISIVSTLHERRREMAILRSVGARPGHIFGLLTVESFLIALSGVLLGFVLIHAGLFMLDPLLRDWFGLYLDVFSVRQNELTYMGLILVGGLVAGALPALRAVRMSLADGLTIRL